jgi:hypothetical protein
MKKVFLEIEDFRQAAVIFKDLAFEDNFDSSNEEHIRALKIFEARKQNIDFEIELAERICGDNNNYPYRSSYYLTKFYQDLGFNYEHSGEKRRFWVQRVLKELSIGDLVVVIEKGLFRKRDFQNLSFRHSDKNEISSEEFLQTAIKDFRKFINESISANETVSLVDILDLNINLELLFEYTADTEDEELNKLIEEAKSRFLNPKDKYIAIEKLWDAFERIKTYFDSGKQKSKSADKLVNIISNGFNKSIFNEEFRMLTDVGNNYRIRHHETDKSEINNSKHLNYLFFRMLCLIDLCLISLKEDTHNKANSADVKSRASD